MAAPLPVLLSLVDDLDPLTGFPSSFYSEPALSICRWPTWDQLSRLDKELGPVSPIGKDGFQVCMDVVHFKPSELTIRVVDDCVLVEGKHEEREDDHGLISRHFVRRCALPKGFDPDKVVSTLSSDGVLTVTAPKPRSEENAKERLVQIQQTGPAHLNVKENAADTDTKTRKKDETPKKKEETPKKKDEKQKFKLSQRMHTFTPTETDNHTSCPTLMLLRFQLNTFC